MVTELPSMELEDISRLLMCVRFPTVTLDAPVIALPVISKYPVALMIAALPLIVLSVIVMLTADTDVAGEADVAVSIRLP